MTIKDTGPLHMNTWHEAAVFPGEPSIPRVGLVAPFSGVLGIIGPSIAESVAKAAQSVISETSLDGIEVLMVDSGQPGHLVARQIDTLQRVGGVRMFVGAQTSQALEAIQGNVADGSTYILATGHEGELDINRFVSRGETPADGLPGLEWLMQAHGAQSWAVVSTDYSYPLISRALQRSAIRTLGGQVKLDIVLEHGAVKHSLKRLLAQLRASGVQGIILNMVGRDLIQTLRSIRDTRHHRGLVTYAPGVLDENVLLALGGDETGKLYSMMRSVVPGPGLEQREPSENPEGPVDTTWSVRASLALRQLFLERGSIDYADQSEESVWLSVAKGPDLVPVYHC